MAEAACEICLEKESKYCCPSCERRTCSLACVREHKVKFDCEGLKGRPTAPEASHGPEKYSQDLFMKDYAFLEGVSTYTGQLEHNEPKIDAGDVRKEKTAEFKKIQKVAKMMELRMLPSEFSRSKKNRTHLIVKDVNSIVHLDDKTSTSVIEQQTEMPEIKTSRMAKISWTLDLVHYDNGKLIETKFGIEDDLLLSEIIPETATKLFLRNETKMKGADKWREVSSDASWRQKRLGQVLVGARCFEYPILGLEF